MSYSERLRVPWWWLAIGLLLASTMAVAVLAYVPLEIGIAFSVCWMLGLLLLLISYSRTRISVDAAQGLKAGRNTLGPAYIASATPLEGEAARAALGPETDHRAFLFTRPFISSLVRVGIDDPADPHPYWLLSTRRPHELAAALDQVRAP